MLTTRLQWVDSPFRHKTFFAVKDMVSKDGVGIFYKGLIPVLHGQLYIYMSVEWSRILVFELQNSFFEFAWPLLILTGWLLGHPQNVLASKLYCGRFTHSRNQNIYGNSLSIMQHIVKTRGIRGLYVGFGPACVLYSCFYHEGLFYLCRNSIKKYKNMRNK